MALLGARALLLRGRLLQSQSGNGAGKAPARAGGAGVGPGARAGAGEVREEVSAHGWGGWACSGSEEPGRSSERGSESIGVSERGSTPRSEPPLGCA